MRKDYFGNGNFYRRVWSIALPIVIQNFITNFVSMLDNIMVGQLSTAQISGVTIANNNLLFIFNLCLFGAAAGAGIFTAQFHGRGDQEGIQYTFRYKLYLSLLLTAIGTTIFGLFPEQLISLYLQGQGDPAMAADVLHYGKLYLYAMLPGLLPFALTNTYASTLRECGHPTMPMVAGIIATFVNLVLNYVLIFGHFGAPAMGVTGAAIATVISRYVEFAIVAICTHVNVRKNPYIQGVFRHFTIPTSLLRTITWKGLPLLFNELTFSVGIAIVNQCYSTCGLDVVPAFSISTTIYNLAGVVFRALATTVGIIMGQMLGAGAFAKEVRSENRKLLTLSTLSGAVFGLLCISLSKIFPGLYNTSDQVKDLARWLIIISALFMPLQAYYLSVYFTLRSGGNTFVTLLFDSGTILLLSIPSAFFLSRFTNLSILPLYTICCSLDLLKCVLGYILIRKGSWIRNLTRH